jgi:hypothetical protein
MASHCRRSSRQVPPNLCRRMAARPHADRPHAHAADGRFSTPRGGHGDVWAPLARAHDHIQRPPRAWVTLKATGTPPRGRLTTTTRSPRRCPNRAARRRLASARSSKTYGYPCQRRTADNPSLPPGRQRAIRTDGHLRQAAGCNSKARRMAVVSAEGLGIPALARSPWGLHSGDGSQRDRAAGGTSCRDAPGPSPLGIKAVAARQRGKRSRCSRRSAGTAGAGSGRASRRGEGADHPLGEDAIRLAARLSDGSRRPLTERFQAKGEWR